MKLKNLIKVRLKCLKPIYGLIILVFFENLISPVGDILLVKLLNYLQTKIKMQKFIQKKLENIGNFVEM